MEVFELIAKESAQAFTVNDKGALEKFKNYGVALYVMTDAYSPAMKTEIHGKLEEMKTDCLQKQAYGRATFYDDMMKLDWAT